ncbi:MAG TPA: family 16 glycosylhydrolase [Trebonia sp.]|nr:family 16 glycosylhydrolase [Trebonia sp.]
MRSRKGHAAGLVVAVLAGALGFAGCGNADPPASDPGPVPAAAQSPARSPAPTAVDTPVARRSSPAARVVAGPRSPARAHPAAATGTPAAPRSPAAARSRGSAAGVARAKPSPSDVPPASPFSLGSGWKTTLDATFTGSALDPSLWATCYPWAQPGGCTNFGNAEYEWYQPSQVQVSGGLLHLVAQRVPTQGLAQDGSAKTYAYRSGMVTTFPGLAYQYGYIQVVARIPYGPGLWPALWLAAASQKWPPEIDMLEHEGTAAQYTEHLHATDMSVQAAAESAENLSVGWHTFGLYWSPSRVIWYVDGHQVMSAVSGVPRQPMYFLADLAVSQQDPAGWKDSAALDIRSVTLWQAASY